MPELLFARPMMYIGGVLALQSFEIISNAISVDTDISYALNSEKGEPTT
jgi:hypothetical protein